jgi:hypothetical protein
MRSAIFVFLGVKEAVSGDDIVILKSRLETKLAGNIQPIEFELKEALLILSLRNPDFHIYLSFVNNNRAILEDWKQLSRDFELPWDIKPVDNSRLRNIFARLEKEQALDYKPIHQLGFTILTEMENLKDVKVFTIPSMSKSSFWNRIQQL